MHCKKPYLPAGLFEGSIPDVTPLQNMGVVIS